MSEKPLAPPRVDWIGADLRNMNFAGMSLEGSDMRATDVSGSNFTGSNLRYVDFRGARMVGTMFQDANLFGAKMQGVEAEGANFRGADMRLSNFGGAYTDGAIMPTPSPADLLDRGGRTTQRQQDKPPAESQSGKEPPSPDRQDAQNHTPNQHPKV
jgi:uncharacterized protein YjbI with pentapeptide repeats